MGISINDLNDSLNTVGASSLSGKESVLDNIRELSEEELKTSSGGSRPIIVTDCEYVSYSVSPSYPVSFTYGVDKINLNGFGKISIDEVGKIDFDGVGNISIDADASSSSTSNS